KWVSCEPLLSPVRLTEEHRFLEFVVIGSESGTHRLRETKNDWVRDLVGDCHTLGIPVFVKQLWGPPLEENHKPRCLKHIEDWPEDLRVQEIPDFRRMLIAGRKKELDAQQDLFAPLPTGSESARTGTGSS
ncbi:MAG: phage Gp37/Gp68 family protein, partial [Patescibacteria group bacterium]|nr:phage Gp37/Gp68 family protein [Patescibacteria group bacterium]